MEFGFFAKISCLFAKNMATNQTKHRIDQCQNVPSTFFGTNIWSDQYFCLICSQKTLQTFLGFSVTHSRLELIKSIAVPFISSNLLCIHYLVSHSCISPNAVQSHIFGYDEAKKATVISSDTFKTRSKSFKVNRIKCVADFISVFTV